MQSKDQKIYKLILSEDDDARQLGQQALLGHLSKENVIYWYILLEKYRDILNTSLTLKISEILEWPSESLPLENLSKIVRFMQVGEPNAESVLKFTQYYNDYLLNLIMQPWTVEKRKECLNQINQINDNKSSTKSNKDL